MKKLKLLKKNKKGFSLVELIVAILLLAIISTSLSSIMGSTLSLYNRAEMQSLLYNVSQKLHIALENELMTARDLNLYTSTVQPSTVLKEEYQYMLKVNNGTIVKYKYDTATKQIKSEQLLLSEKSYRGATVKSFSMGCDKVMDREFYSDSSLKQCWRIVYFTTVIEKNGVQYSHTSAVRLYNMGVYGTGLKIEKKVGSTTTFVDPTASKKDGYSTVVYFATQYFNG